MSAVVAGVHLSDGDLVRLLDGQAEPRESAWGTDHLVVCVDCDRRLRNQLVEDHQSLVEPYVRRFDHKGVSADDLRQVALIATIKAVERFDPDYGVTFSTFAGRTIEGELMRLLRDRGWSVRPPRRHQEVYLAVRRAEEELTQSSGRSPTIAELARATGINPAGLTATVERFNAFAATGVDEEFGRGGNAHDRFYSDSRVRPNPTLGRISRAPFSAVRVYPGDLGTNGGILTDQVGRALAEDGAVIEGLYAAGNAAASVMGATYPGPGAPIAAAMVFGFLAGRHMSEVE